MSGFAEVIADAGYLDKISDIVDGTLERAERNQELCAFPELRRVKGQLLLSRKKPDPDPAGDTSSGRSIALAQSAPACKLRTAISIALLKREQGQAGKGRALLQAAYACFTEGLDTADLKRASVCSTNSVDCKGSNNRTRPLQKVS
jgi:adenylate cyclase